MLNWIARVWRTFFQVKCKRCGKPLYSKKSRMLGYGAECARGSAATIEREKLERAGQTALFNKDT